MANRDRVLSHLSASLPTTRQSRTLNPFSDSLSKIQPTRLNKYIAPISFERLAHDIIMWRDSIREAENPWYPSRVKMTRMYIDTVENTYVKAVIDRWKEIIMQRDIEIYQIKGEEKVVSKVLSQQLESQSWFLDYMEYTAEAKLHSYSLISLGDIVQDSFPNISLIPRENIVPDDPRREGPLLTSMVYAMNGIEITENPLIDLCNHWISTKSNRGVTRTGYGDLYSVALAEIHLRHILEWNADFAEMFGQPTKVGWTKKTGKDRDDFENWLASSGSDSYVLLDPTTDDKLIFEQAANIGTAWKSYDNLEKRLEDKIAQLMLGHTDAMKSTAGKLGGMQNSNKDGNNINLVQQAMNSKQVTNGNFVSRKINEVAAPRFRKLGKMVGSKIIQNLIPEGYFFGLQNDTEENEIIRRRNDRITKVSVWVKNLNDSGWDVAKEDLERETGLTLTAKAPERKLIEERKVETVNDTQGTANE